MAILDPATEPATYRKSPIGAFLSILTALIYGVSPIDLIIDIIPLFGWADDVAVVSTLLVLAWHLIKKRKRKLTATMTRP